MTILEADHLIFWALGAGGYPFKEKNLDPKIKKKYSGPEK